MMRSCEYDRYGGPRAWDEHCARAEEAREREIANSTCGGCSNYSGAPEDYVRVECGWCSECEDFTEAGTVANEAMCDGESFEAA